MIIFFCNNFLIQTVYIIIVSICSNRSWICSKTGWNRIWKKQQKAEEKKNEVIIEFRNCVKIRRSHRQKEILKIRRSSVSPRYNQKDFDHYEKISLNDQKKMITCKCYVIFSTQRACISDFIRVDITKSCNEQMNVPWSSNNNNKKRYYCDITVYFLFCF